jgi:hypothetical protein
MYWRVRSKASPVPATSSTFNLPRSYVREFIRLASQPGCESIGLLSWKTWDQLIELTVIIRRIRALESLVSHMCDRIATMTTTASMPRSGSFLSLGERVLRHWPGCGDEETREALSGSSYLRWGVSDTRA